MSTIYHLFHDYESFDHGTYEHLEGTYSSLEAAQIAAELFVQGSIYYKHYRKVNDSLYVADRYDQDTQTVRIQSALMNRFLNSEE